MVTERQLFDDYSFYRQYTANYKRLKEKCGYLHPLKPTGERLALFAQLIAWCRNRNVPPRQWLYSLFGTRRWTFAPRLKLCDLCSENHFTKFQNFDDYTFYLNRLRELEQIEGFGSGFDPNTDLNTTSESAKAEYLKSGNIQTCIDQMTTETFGYHPKSSVCRRCSGAVACLRQLQHGVSFDILALRSGDLSVADARAQSNAGAAVRGRSYE